MLRLALKRNSLLLLFTLFAALFVAACGEEDSATVPTASTTNCADYSYTATSTLTVSPSGFSWASEVAAGTSATFSSSPAKITIISGVPPFGLSSQSFAGLALGALDGAGLPSGNPAVPFTFGSGFLEITASQYVPANFDPSCTTYALWVAPVGNFFKGSYSDTVTIIDARGSFATVTIAVVITE